MSKTWTPTLIGTLLRTGYDREEEYFFHLNQGLLEELRRQAAGSAGSLGLNSREHCQLNCPGCGGSMSAAQGQGLNGHVCSCCGGVYLGRDALQHYTGEKGDRPIVEGFKRLLAKATKPLPTGIGQFPI